MSLKEFWKIMDANKRIPCWYALRSWFETHEKLDRELFKLIEHQFPLFHGEARDQFMEMKRKILGEEKKKEPLKE